MTENLAAFAEGTYTQYGIWSLPKIPAVAAPDDDDASGVFANGGVGNRQSFTLATSAIPPGSTINSVTVHGRHDWYAHASTMRHFLRLGASEVYSAEYPLLELIWQNYDSPLTRPGGGSWQLADLATLEIGLQNVTGSFDYCTTFFAIIDYTPPAAGPSGDMLLCMQ